MPNLTNRKLKTAEHNKILLVLLCVWLVIQLLSFAQFGIVTNNEAVKYRNEAYNFAQHGHFSEPRYIFYAAYVFLHVIFIKAGFESIGVFVVQLLVNLVAMFCFFKTASNLFNNSRYAFLSTVLLILCYPWQYWTNFLYTESLFCSLIIIFTFLLFGTDNKDFTRYLAMALTFVLILLARPTGMLLIPALCFLLLYNLLVRKKFLIAFFSGVASSVGFILLLNYAMEVGSGFDFIKPILENNVLCYIPAQPQTTTPVNDNAATAIIDYFKSDPINFLKLSGLKFLSYWGLTRPYYSTFHNWLLRLYFYPIYFFAFIGILSLKEDQRYFAAYSIGMLLIFTLSVILTCDDWNNRFLMPVIPLVMLLAGFGVRRVHQIFHVGVTTKAAPS